MVGIRGKRIFQKIKNTATTASVYIYIYIYIYLLLSFVINNRQQFKINSGICNVNTRNNLDLHYSQSHLWVYQKGAHCSGIKVFNRLPIPIKQLSHDTKQFKMALKGFCISIPFYSLDEYFKYNTNSILKLFM
jgi:hypothetical protein